MSKYKKTYFRDLSGMRVGYLLIVCPTGDYEYHHSAKSPVYMCRCDCGKEIAVPAYLLTTARVNNCGCVAPPVRRRLGE